MDNFELIAQATQAIAANFADVSAYWQRAILLHDMGQYREALADLDMLLDTRHAEKADTYLLRSSVRLKLGDKDGALSDMRHAIELDPSLLKECTGQFKSK